MRIARTTCTFRKSNMTQRRPYIPQTLPLTGLNYKELLPLVSAASGALSRYDVLVSSIPEPEIFLAPLMTREAVVSSKIEGTRVTVDQVLEQDAGIEQVGQARSEADEVRNYRTAMREANTVISERPIRLGLIRQLHSILLSGTRGEHKSPGAFRTIQNFIGGHGDTLETAIFIPPDPVCLPMHLEHWERYIGSSDDEVLIQTAVMHAQFELLHPFLDGNGRIGRLLIPLFLTEKGALSAPMFYISEYLEENRSTYYDRLLGISKSQDWDAWISFFLTAIHAQATSNNARLDSILALYEDMKARVHDITGSQYSQFLVDAMFTKPKFNTSDISERLEHSNGVKRTTTAHHVRQLRDAGILIEIQASAGRKPAVYSFQELIRRVEGRT